MVALSGGSGVGVWAVALPAHVPFLYCLPLLGVPAVPFSPSPVASLAKDCLEARPVRGGRTGTEERCHLPNNAPFLALPPTTPEPGSALSPLFSCWLLEPALTSPGVLLPGPSPGSGSGEESLLEQLGNKAGNPQPCGEGDKQERVKGLGLVAFDGD